MVVMNYKTFVEMRQNSTLASEKPYTDKAVPEEVSVLSKQEVAELDNKLHLILDLVKEVQTLIKKGE